MNNTTLGARRAYRELLSATDPSRRIRMMSGMFSAAKALACASTEGSDDAAESPLSVLFRRIYRTDFSEHELSVIAAHLEAVHSK